MTAKCINRIVPPSGDHYGSDSGSSKEEEKTIPFLRRLVDMLGENENVISFCPGSMKKGQATLGRIVVHDRLKVEAHILPRYFNHSSFASLRRQLNYFSFTRLGKGRQRGATYCNKGVVELDDILRLKRRSSLVGSCSSASIQPVVATPSPPIKTSGKRERSVSLSSASSQENEDFQANPSTTFRCSKKVRPSVVSPYQMEDPTSSNDIEQTIALDLTLPASQSLTQEHHYYPAPLPRTMYHASRNNGDADVLAGCRALLSFSRSAQVIRGDVWHEGGNIISR